MTQHFPLPEGPPPPQEVDARTKLALEVLDAELRFENEFTTSLSPRTELHRRVRQGVESTVIIAVPDQL